jgi:hypothetical protein
MLLLQAGDPLLSGTSRSTRVVLVSAISSVILVTASTAEPEQGTRDDIPRGSSSAEGVPRPDPAARLPTVVEFYIPTPGTLPAGFDDRSLNPLLDIGQAGSPSPDSSLSRSAPTLSGIARPPLSSGALAVVAAGPGNPILTEVYQEPPATGGPAVRNPADPHQEFIEIYLPTLAALAPGLNGDALNLTLYDVEGDSSSLGLTQVNYRIDLPTFDLDPSNGLTGLPRPASGLVVLGWVDYVGNPPTALAGTPGTRVALINGGVTSTSDFTFIAINGSHFSGTTNFPVPAAISHLDSVSDPVSGKIEQGSSAYLLVNRDDPGYLELCALDDPSTPCDSFPNLPAGTVLGVSSLLDGLAPNDDSNFIVSLQPYPVPTGDNIDLEFVLPFGGAFSLLVPQLPEQANGYRRLFTDVTKTSEDGILANENPALDAVNAYDSLSNSGPFRATPGFAAATTSNAILSVADSVVQNFEVLTGTTARPGLVAANTGGNFGMVTITTPGAAANPAEMNFSPATSAFDPQGQTAIAPALEVQTFATTPPGYVDTISIQVDAGEAALSDPPIGSPTAVVNATFTTIDPTTGLNALGQAFQATALVAIQGLPDEPGVANEFLATSLAARMASGLGTSVFDTLGNGTLLLNPLTDLSNPLVVDPILAELPTDPLFYINPLGATSDLLTLVSTSAEAQSKTTYTASIASSRVQAREFAISEIPTSGSTFVPSERIHYTNANGLPGAPSSGLSDVVTTRGFEFVLIDTNLRQAGTIESGATDDFGLVVEIGSTRLGASVVPGEFVFLSLMGGLEGADVDNLKVPPSGNLTNFNLMNLIYVDLDPLDSVLGAETITKVIVVDGSGNGEVDIMELIAVPEPGATLGLVSGIILLAGLHARRKRSL